ncbi:putative esterase [Motilibacter rhizosphaerae]|uniref:Putative esterase n=1 Tax=Motilibacter rhizosphaerae TaxID=598652 RepID=A0A4V2F4X3_9ACTN|nr:alpha/beta hydrolase-fold protein [Motilibacter rhizosphaerae]RZS90819.1 putative esterase [Motilibacter rhizosphaerae]
MALTGTALLVLVVLAAAALFGLLVAGWSRLAPSGPLPVALRGGSLLLLNVLVLLATALALNDHFLFYASWTDLADGAAQSVATSREHGAAPGTAFAVTPPDHRARPVPAQLQPLPAGVDAAHPDFLVDVPGRSGVTAQVAVSLPAAYFTAAGARERFPVLEAFPGFPSTDEQWLHTLRLPGATRRAAAQGVLDQPIVVSPTTEVPAARDTECVDGGLRDPRVADWLDEDVPDWVVGHLRADPARTSWATIGISEGGWCAALATMTHPDRFAAAVVLGGYFRPDFSSWVPYAPGSAAYAALDLVRRAHDDPPPVALWVQTSLADPLSLPTSTAVSAAARSPLSVRLVELRHAGHRIQVWQAQLPAALRWLGSTVPGFAPRST